MVSCMIEAQIENALQDQEKELINILIDSELYLDMNLTERQKLLNYLVTSYCHISGQ